MSQLTTHILDTSIGKPAANVEIILEKEVSSNSWEELSRGKTNEDGRLPGLLSDDYKMEFGNYRLTFQTKPYYDTIDTAKSMEWKVECKDKTPCKIKYIKN